MSLPKAKTLAAQLRKVVKGAKRLEVDSDMKKHAVYELWVALQAIKDIRQSYKVTLENTTVPKQLQFPLAPGEKENFPFMKAWLDGKCRFQICLGTRYKCASGTAFAPDLSIQSANASPTTPDTTEVIFCWDCKFYEDKSKSLPRVEVAALIGYTTQTYQPTAPPVGRSIFTSTIWPEGNAVLTNRKSSNYADADLQAVEVSEVWNLYPRSRPKRRP